MTIHELDTPCLLVNLDALHSNLKRMADYCRKHGLNLRPHTKTHKSPDIARLQIAQGFPGITCAKVGEAEVMAEHGITDILICFPVVGEIKTQRLCRLTRKAKIAVALDSVEAADGIAREAIRQGVTIDVLVEINVGMNRVGVETPELLVALAEKVHRMKGLRLRGIACYPGHLFSKPNEQERPLRELGDRLTDLRLRFRAKGLDDRWVSAGSTPTAYQSHFVRGITEIRPGQYPLNDRNMLGVGACTLNQCAFHVMTTVVSTAVRNHAMMDGGTKTFSSDRYILAGAKTESTYGLVRDDENIVFCSMSEEHGHLDVSRAHRPLNIGQRLRVLPNHVCPTVNLHEKLYGIRGETVETVWEIKGRGKIQ
ncbi:MAG: alanine racemase [Verrucomicrobia bacterium]|nr:alanine racemase [Verrucomicrobiota bacterium]